MERATLFTFTLVAALMLAGGLIAAFVDQSSHHAPESAQREQRLLRYDAAPRPMSVVACR